MIHVVGRAAFHRGFHQAVGSVGAGYGKLIIIALYGKRTAERERLADYGKKEGVVARRVGYRHAIGARRQVVDGSHRGVAAERAASGRGIGQAGPLEGGWRHALNQANLQGAVELAGARNIGCAQIGQPERLGGRQGGQ